jgi:hypothetical protein
MSTDSIADGVAALDVSTASADEESTADFAAPPYDPSTLISHAGAASAGVWPVDALRSGQADTLAKLFDPSTPSQLIVCERTGSGKTHIVRTAGVMVRGVVVIIIPLLALSADVHERFTCGLDRFGTVSAYHLDDMWETTRSKYYELVKAVRELQPDTTSTYFLMISPQFFLYHDDLVDALLMAANANGTLRLVVCDEIHLMVQQGMTFRYEIRALRDRFFRPIFHPHPSVHSISNPYFVGLSGSVPDDYIEDIATLTTIPFPEGSVLRGSPDTFAQRDIRMELSICNPGDFTRYGLNEVTEFLKDQNSGSVAIFVNSRYNSVKVTNDLEAKLNKAHCSVDGIFVNGAMTKMDKFTRTKIFCSDEEVEGIILRFLVATNAINVGIDKPSIKFVVRYELPRDLPTMFQERSRGNRLPGVECRYILYIDLASYVFLKSQILQSNDDLDRSPGDSATNGLGTAITPLARRAAAASDPKAPPPPRTTRDNMKEKYKLKTAEIRKNKKRASRELLEVLRFNCLKTGVECQHRRAEIYLSTGLLDPPEYSSKFTCDGQCSVCSGEWDKLFRPVYKESVVAFFRSGAIQNTLPMTVTKGKTISNILKNNQYWCTKIFDIAKPQKKCVDGLFFSLIACGIVDLERVNGIIRWNICRESTAGNRQNDQPVYESDEAWRGINMFDPARPRVNDPDEANVVVSNTER